MSYSGGDKNANARLLLMQCRHNGHITLELGAVVCRDANMSGEDGQVGENLYRGQHDYPGVHWSDDHRETENGFDER